MATKVKKNRNLNKKRPADRDSSDADADEPETLPAKSKAPLVDAKPVKDGKKSASSAASDGKAAPVDREALIEEALKVVDDGISKPDAQIGGRGFVPRDWHLRFAPELGKYRKFLNKHPEKFVVVDTENGNFVVKRAGEAVPSTRSGWIKVLETAWKAYCAAVPKDERDVSNFIAAIPGQSKNKERPPSSPRSSPKSSPKAAPATAPASGKSVSPKLSPKSNPKAAPEAAPALRKVKKKLKKKGI